MKNEKTVKDYLEEFSYDKGCFGFIKKCKSNNNYIIKYSFDDKGYVLFLKYVIKNKNINCLPIIKSVYIDKNNAIVKMEKLYNLTYKQRGFFDTLSELYEEWFDEIINGKTTMRDIIKYAKLDCEYRIKLSENFIHCIEDLQKISKNEKEIWFDFHGDNIMRRKNGTFVIIDPLCPDNPYGSY